MKINGFSSLIAVCVLSNPGLSQPCGSAPTINFNQNTIDLCIGESGTSIATVVGGVGDIQYNWFPVAGNGNSMTDSPSDLFTWYYLEITDDCFTVLDSMRMDVHPIAPTSINVTDATNCPGLPGTLGALQILPDNPGWTYSIYGGGLSVGPVVTSTFSNLPGGIIYWVHITNTYGCVLDTAVEVSLGTNEVLATFNTSVLQNEICFGDTIGVAEVLNVNGGLTAPYTIYWSKPGGSYSDTIVALGGGDYIDNLPGGGWVVSAVDQDGCAWSEFFNIAEPDPFEFSFIVSNPTCNEFSDGSVSVIIDGGNGGNSITLSDSSGTILNVGGLDFANDLSEGWYYCQVTDLEGCVGFDSAFIDAPPAFGASFDFVNPWCAEDGDGAIYVYNVVNTHGNDFDVAYFWNPDPLGISGIGADTLENVNGGEYELTINDSWGCSKVFDVFLWPDTLYFVTLGTTTSTSGNDGVVFCTVGGGDSPYSYLWTYLGDMSTFTTATVSGLPPGVYVIQVTDASNCTKTDTVVIEMLSTTGFSQDKFNVSCTADNKIIVNCSAANGTDFAMQLFDVNGRLIDTFSVYPGQNIFPLGPTSGGCYYYVILDENQQNHSGKIQRILE